MKNLWVRTVSGAVLAVVMLGAIAWSQWSFGLLLAALLVVGMTEFYSLAEEQGSNPQRIVGLAAGLVLFALNFAFVSDDIQILGSARQAFACGMALLLLLLPAMFICELYRRRENPAANIGITFMGVVYVALPFSLMCYIPIIGSEAWSPWMMIFYVFIIWANDVFAYLVGMSVARRGRYGGSGRTGGVDVQARRRGQGFGNVDSRSRRSAGPLRRHAALGAVRLRLYAFCDVTANLTVL